MNENGTVIPEGIDVDAWSQPRELMTVDQWLMLVLILIAVAAAVLAVWLLLVPLIRRKSRARKIGIDLSLLRLARLSFSGVNTNKLLGEAGRLRQAQINDITFDQLVSYAQRGGDTRGVVDALIQARRCGVRFDWDVLCRIGLAGRDPSAVVKDAASPWTMAVPGDLLFGEPIPAIAGDGVELRIRGEAKVISRPNEDNPVPREPAMVARIAQKIVSAVGRCRDHGQVLRNPQLINDEIDAAELTAEPGLRLLRFRVTHIERGSMNQARANDHDGARARIDKMLQKQPIDQMSSDELAQLAPAYLQFDDAEAARGVCEQALTKDATHERANKWLHEALVQGGASLDEQLAHADGCIAGGVEPTVGWRLIRASILCRMATETDAASGEVSIVDRERYVAAAGELRSLGGADAALAKRGVAEGWIDSWDAAFPGIEATNGRLAEVEAEPAEVVEFEASE